MPEAAFPKSVVEVVTTLAEIFRNQRRSEVVELLESANATIEQIGYDNWNGGTYDWALRLDVPVPCSRPLSRGSKPSRRKLPRSLLISAGRIPMIT